MSDDQTTSTAPPKKAGRGRRIFVALLVIAGCVLAPISLVAVWTRNTLLNTDNYVSTVAPLASNPDVINAAADRITDRVMAATDIKERLTESLPPRAQRAAPAMTQGIENVVHDGAVKILSSDQFANIWEQANRRVHAQVVTALTGKTARGVSVNNGDVTLDLSAVAARVRERISGLGLNLSSKLPKDKIPAQLVLFHSPYVGWTQDGVEGLQKMAWLFPLLTILCFGGAIALSPNRRRTTLRSGIGFSAAIAVFLILVALGRVPYLGLFPRPAGKLAGGAAYDQILESLRLAGRALFVLGIIVALGAWLSGPSAGAVRLRAMFTGKERSSEPGPFATWVGHARVGLRVVVIMLGAIALIAVDQPTGWTVVIIAVIVLLLIALIEFVGRSARPAVSEAV